jgi:ribosomal protein S18 acetylase RimI-like enzyme
MLGKRAMSEITIREYVPEKNQKDADILLPAFLAIWNDPENLKYLSFTQKPFDESTVKDWFSNHLSFGGHYYVAIERGEWVSGIAAVKTNPVEGFEILGIGVRLESKSQGIGTKLLEHVFKVASECGFKAVDTIVFADNITMLRLLLSLSFVPVNMQYNRRVDGADTLLMRKLL